MKSRSSFPEIAIIAPLLLAAAIISSVIMFEGGPPARAQTVVAPPGPTLEGSFVGFPSTMPASATSNQVGTAVTVLQHRGMYIQATFSAPTNTATASTVQYKFQVNPDALATSTNWTTITYVGPTFAINGTNLTSGATNIPAAWIDNFRWIRPAGITSTVTDIVSTASVLWSQARDPIGGP